MTAWLSRFPLYCGLPFGKTFSCCSCYGPMIALSLACFIALLLSPLGLAQKPDPLAKITGKTIQYEYNADFGLMDDLPVIPGRLEPSPLAAQTCQFPEGLEDFGCSSGVQMFVITLEDCATPWTLCYCPLSEATPEQALAAFGRVPIGLRRNVEVFHLYPSSAKIPDSGLGFYISNAIFIVDQVGRQDRLHVWLHESMHSADGGRQVSSSPEWAHAVQQDSCLISGYAAENYVENFAEAGTLMLYNLFHGKLPTGIDRACMANQLAYMESLPLFNRETLFGGTCAFAATPGDEDVVHTLAPAVVKAPQLDAIISAANAAPTVDEALVQPLAEDRQEPAITSSDEPAAALPLSASSPIGLIEQTTTELVTIEEYSSTPSALAAAQTITESKSQRVQSSTSVKRAEPSSLPDDRTSGMVMLGTASCERLERTMALLVVLICIVSTL